MGENANQQFVITSNATRFAQGLENTRRQGITLPHYRCTDGVVTPKSFVFFVPMEAYSNNATTFGSFNNTFLGAHYDMCLSFFLDAFSNPMCGSPSDVMIQPCASCGPIDKEAFNSGQYLPEQILREYRQELVVQPPNNPNPQQPENPNPQPNNPAAQAMRKRVLAEALKKVMKREHGRFKTSFQTADFEYKEKVSVFIETVIKQTTGKVKDICQENIAGFRIVVIVNDMRMSILSAIKQQIEDNNSQRDMRLSGSEPGPRSRVERQAVLRKKIAREAVNVNEAAHTDCFYSANTFTKMLKALHPRWYNSHNAVDDDSAGITSTTIMPLTDENYARMVMERHGACDLQRRSLFVVKEDNTIELNFSIPHLVVRCSVSDFNIETLYNKMFPFLPIRFNNPMKYSLDNELTLVMRELRESVVNTEDRLRENFAVFSTGDLQSLSSTTKVPRSHFQMTAEQAKPYIQEVRREAMSKDPAVRNSPAAIKKWVNVHNFFWDYFKRIFDPKSYLSDAMIAIILYGQENFVRKKQPICVEKNKLAANLSSQGNFFASRLLVLDCLEQILYAHNSILHINDCCMLSYIRLPLHNHVFVSGGPAESKTFAAKHGAVNFLIPGTSRMEAGSSCMSMFNESGIANSQTVLVIDEMPDIFFRAIDSLNSQQSRTRQLFQASLTNGDISLRRATFRQNPKDPKHAIGTVETITPVFEAAVIGSTNRVNFDLPIKDRSMLILALEIARNLEGRDSHNFINHVPTPEELHNEGVLREEYRNQQLLCALILTAIEIGILAEVPMEMFNMYYDRALEFVYSSNLCPKLSDRVAQQCRNLYLIYTILYAIYMHFHSELSPFRGRVKVHRDNDGNMYGDYYEVKNFEFDDIKGIDVYFAPNEERVFSVLTQIFSLHIRDIDYLMIQGTAVTVGKFKLDEIRDYVRQYSRNRCAFNLCGKHTHPGANQECPVDMKYINYMSSTREVPEPTRIDKCPDKNNMMLYSAWLAKDISVGIAGTMKYNRMLSACNDICIEPMRPMFEFGTKRIENFLIRKVHVDAARQDMFLDPNYITVDGRCENDIIKNIMSAINTADYRIKQWLGIKSTSIDSITGVIKRLKDVMWNGPYIELIPDRADLTYEELAYYLHPDYLSGRAKEPQSKPVIEVISKERNHCILALNIHVFFRETGRWVEDMIHSLCHKHTRERDVVVAGAFYKGYPQLYRVVHLKPRPDVVLTINNALYRPKRQNEAVFESSMSKRSRIRENEASEVLRRALRAEDSELMEFDDMIDEQAQIATYNKRKLFATTSSQRKLTFDFDLEAYFTTEFNYVNRFDAIEMGKLNHPEMIERRINRLYGLNDDPIHPNDEVLKMYLNDPVTAEFYRITGQRCAAMYPDDFTDSIDLKPQTPMEVNDSVASSSSLTDDPEAFVIISNNIIDNMAMDE